MRFCVATIFVFRLQHSYSSRTGVGKLFIRRARFEKTVEAAVRTVIGKQGEDFFLEITCSDLVTTMYDNLNYIGNTVL